MKSVLSKSALVTGTAQGIGRATALHLARSGWLVHAGVRRAEDGDALVAASAGSRGELRPVLLDVTDSSHLDGLADVIASGLDAVVNNAATMVTGPVESIDSATLRNHFEVNVVGAMAVTRVCLPHLRAAGGRVIFVSSVSGRIVTPWMGPYCASKFALEAMADALRMELRPWKIGVSIIEPGVTATDLWASETNVLDTTDIELSEGHSVLYHRHVAGMRNRMMEMRKGAVPIDRVVKTIDRALTSTRPSARYTVDLGSAARISAMAVMPTGIADSMLSRMSGIPRRV